MTPTNRRASCGVEPSLPQNLIQSLIHPSIPSKIAHASNFPQNAPRGHRFTLQAEMAYCHRDFGAWRWAGPCRGVVWIVCCQWLRFCAVLVLVSNNGKRQTWYPVAVRPGQSNETYESMLIIDISLSLWEPLRCLDGKKITFPIKGRDPQIKFCMLSIIYTVPFLLLISSRAEQHLSFTTFCQTNSSTSTSPWQGCSWISHNHWPTSWSPNGTYPTRHAIHRIWQNFWLIIFSLVKYNDPKAQPQRLV